jgi:hypothetical protein
VIYKPVTRISRARSGLAKEQLALFEAKENLDFKGSDTQYSTHAIHTYVAAMVPQLAENLVTTYVPPGEKVLDPFCGGGAVLVECVRHGRKAYGSDVNSLAVLIAKVKSTYVQGKEIAEACHYVIATSIRNLDGAISFPKEYNLEYWFLPETIAELSSIIKVIKRCEREDKFSKNVIDILKVVFSAAVRDVMLTYRNEVRLRRFEPQDLKRFKPNAFDSFESRSRLAIDRISRLPRGAHAKVDCYPVQRLPYPDKEYHSIICSPPYGDERNGVSYMQFSKYMLYWLGFSREAVLESRRNTLGTSNYNIVLPSDTLEKTFKIIQRKNGDDDSWLSFYKEYYLGLQQMARVTREKIIIVIGNRILKQTVIQNGKITVELMTSLGLKLHKHLQRTLPSKRLPKLRRESNHGFGGAIDKEEILIFKCR